jgi:hypothetical protein
MQKKTKKKGKVIHLFAIQIDKITKRKKTDVNLLYHVNCSVGILLCALKMIFIILKDESVSFMNYYLEVYSI